MTYQSVGSHLVSRCLTRGALNATLSRMTDNSAAPAAPAPAPTTAPKQKLVAGLLGIFLGSLGVHSFYLGKTGKGIIQILVTFVTFGIGALWGFIEGILILVNGGTDANGVELV